VPEKKKRKGYTINEIARFGGLNQCWAFINLFS
jgi:hypothetical protein